MVGSRVAAVRRRLRAPARHAAEGGFTLIEVIVAFAILGIIMTATISFFVSSTKTTSHLRRAQVAVQLADDALEQVNSFSGSNLLAGRSYDDTMTNWCSLRDFPLVHKALSDNGNSNSVIVWDGSAGTNPNSAGAGDCSLYPTASVAAAASSAAPSTSAAPTASATASATAAAALCGTSAAASASPTATATAPTAANGAACVPAGPQSDIVNNTTYYTTTLIGECWQPIAQADTHPVAATATTTATTACLPSGSYNSPTSAGTIDGTVTGTGMPMYRVVAVVRWTSTECPSLADQSNVCMYVASSLTSATKGDPVFNPAATAFNDTDPLATHPGTLALDDIAALSTTVGAQAYYPVTYSGGAGTVSFTDGGTLPDGESIDTDTGLIHGAPTKAGTYNITITATDASNATSSTTFTWTVNGALTLTSPGPQSGDKGSPWTYDMSAQVAGGTGKYTYTLTGQPSGLSINTSTGVVSGTISTGAASTYTPTLTITDSGGGSATTTFAFTVNSALAFTFTGITNTVTWVMDWNPTVYAAQTASGGSGNYTWAASGLPAGLSVSSAGVISGTTTATTASTVTITLTDDAQGVATKKLIWYPKVPTSMTSDANVVSYWLMLGSTKNVAYTWSASAISPTTAGVTVNSTLGLARIGAATAPSGPVTFTVSQKDPTQPAATQTTSNTFTWTLNPAVATVAPAAQTATVGTPFSLQLPASGGSGSYTYAMGTTLPAGLSLNTSTGLISGTPTTAAAAKSFTYTVTDTAAAPGTASTSVSITVAS